MSKMLKQCTILLLAIVLSGCETQVRCSRYDSNKRDTEFRNFEKCCPEGWRYVYNRPGSWEGYFMDHLKLDEYMTQIEKEAPKYTCDKKVTP